MSGTRWTRGAVALVAGLVLAVGGAVAGDSPAFARRGGHHGGSADHSPRQDDDLYGCDRTFGRQPEGHLAKHTEPAAGHDGAPGDTIRVTLTWEPADWSSDRLHKVLDCVAIDGQLVRSMQGGESPTANDGKFTRDYTVPDDAPDGVRICDQAMLSGSSPRADYDRQISNRVCHTVVRTGGSGGRPPCQRGCAEKPPCDRCGDTPPPCDEGCEKAPCDQGCADRAPCDHGCADRSPCDKGCAEGGCGKEDSCDRAPERRDDRHDRDCGCEGHRRHLI
ncbi:MAG: hypothetical protein QOJ23_5088, partial [Actinomycetota bacterium]|nr:hypothetical protein [Actinomycetota bacterium]